MIVKIDADNVIMLNHILRHKVPCVLGKLIFMIGTKKLENFLSEFGIRVPVLDGVLGPDDIKFSHILMKIGY